MQPVPVFNPTPSPNRRETQLRAKANELEASFLAEMLAHAGMGDAQQDFGGGIGEDQFASFLRAEQAKGMVAQGGIGLAEQFFQSLMKRSAP